MKICFVHDWLTNYGGAELVLKTFLEIWPGTPVYTLIYDERGTCQDIIRSTSITGSFINKFPFAKHNHRLFLPLMPLAIKQFDLSNYDLIISDSHAIAKGVTTRRGQCHISYIHTPIRYAWEMQEQYLAYARLDRGFRGLLARSLLNHIRRWDLRTARNVNYFIANSKFVARRIRNYYEREATVIYPPVEVERFKPTAKKDDFYLTISRLVPYKNVDLIVSAFAKMPGKKLVVIGDGPEMKRIRQSASENISIMGYQPNQVVEDYLHRARALIFAAEEDFGIILVESQACGTPVIAYGKGGVLESVNEGETGFFYNEQSIDSLTNAIQAFEKHPPLDVQKMQRNAERFNKDRFKHEIETFVSDKVYEIFSSVSLEGKTEHDETK